MQAALSLEKDEPVASLFLTAINWTRQAMPEMLKVLLPTAPMIPATWVPWPVWSATLLLRTPRMKEAPLRSPKVGAGLRQRFAEMSRWLTLMPLSTIATMTLGASRMMSQAAWALMSAP